MREIDTIELIISSGEERVWQVGRSKVYKLRGGVDPDSVEVNFDDEGLPVVSAVLRGSEGKVKLRHYLNLEEPQIESVRSMDDSLFDDVAEYLADPEAVWRVQTGAKGEKIFDRLTNNRREVGIWRVVQEEDI